MAAALKHFGPLPETSQGVTAYTLSANGLTATFLDYGVILQDLRLDGVPHSLTRGADRLTPYLDPLRYHGGIIGPVANRLANGQAPIAGKVHTFARNEGEQHTLHSAIAGTHRKIWKMFSEDTGSDWAEIIFLIDLPDGEGGFPGQRQMTATYSIHPGPILRLVISTVTDGTPSIVNATNHSYWNLDGTDHMRDHLVQVNAPAYLPCNAQSLPTGEIRPVDGTGFDLNTPRTLIPAEPALDNTFCVSTTRGPLTERVVLRGASGVEMRVATTEPGVHLYDGRDSPTPYEALAIECQGWPDAPNQVGFPSIEISDGPVTQITEWRFSR